MNYVVRESNNSSAIRSIVAGAICPNQSGISSWPGKLIPRSALGDDGFHEWISSLSGLLKLDVSEDVELDHGTVLQHHLVRDVSERVRSSFVVRIAVEDHEDVDVVTVSSVTPEFASVVFNEGAVVGIEAREDELVEAGTGDVPPTATSREHVAAAADRLGPDTE